MDLQHPERKMSKSAASPLGHGAACSTTPDEIERKIRKAVTDTDGEVRYDPAAKPGVSNLLDLLAAASDEPPRGGGRPATSATGDLKADVAEAVVEVLRPVQQRRAALLADPGAVLAALAEGADAGPRGGRRHLRGGRRGDRAARPRT